MEMMMKKILLTLTLAGMLLPSSIGLSSTPTKKLLLALGRFVPSAIIGASIGHASASISRGTSSAASTASSLPSTPSAPFSEGQRNNFMIKASYFLATCIGCYLGVSIGNWLSKKFSNHNLLFAPLQLNYAVPTTRLEDLVGDKPKELVSTLKMLENSEKYKKMGIHVPKGILFYGPPGNGKTEYARAIANKLNAKFFECGSELMGSFYGESPLKIRELFRKARDARRPQVNNNYSIEAVIFIDEIDSIASNRNNLSQRDAGAFLTQTTNALLEELTKENENKNILFIAATNHKDKIDPSLLRPGRIDKIIEIKNPSKESRKAILKHYACKHALAYEIDDEVLFKVEREKLKKGYSKQHNLIRILIDFDALARDTEGFSPAEIKELCHKAAVMAVDSDKTEVTQEDFDAAIRLMRPTKMPEVYVQGAADIKQAAEAGPHGIHG
jgi:ATP-dependent 26S proteasome regulatory subunit